MSSDLRPFSHSPLQNSPFRTSHSAQSHRNSLQPLNSSSDSKTGWTPPPGTLPPAPSRDVVRSSRLFDADRALSSRPLGARPTGKSDRMSMPNLARLNLDQQDFGLEKPSKPSPLALFASHLDWVAPTVAAVLVISVILAGVVSALT